VIPRGKAAVGTVALALGSLALAALLVEAALRAAGYQPERFRNTARVVDSKWRALLDCYPTNPRGYFDIDLRDEETRERYRWMAPVRLDAVARRAPFAVEFRYNALRFRDRELEAKTAGVRRVMVLGDSFTEGQGVKEPDTYPRRLEGLLNAAGQGRWEVRNCGRRATDFPELFAVFEQILAYEPDVVVYGMVLNDADRSPEFQARQSYVNDWILDRGRVLEGGAAPELRPLDSRLFALVTDRVESWRTARATLRWYRDMYGEPNREGWQRTQDYVREMNRRTRARGGRFLVVTWPLLVSLDRYPFADVLKPGVDQETKDWVAVKYFRVTWRQIFEFGTLHTDPHPGNYLVTYHPKLAMLDFGSIRIFPEDIRAAYHGLAAAMLRRDTSTMANCFVRLGFLDPDDDPEPMVRIMDVIFEPVLVDRKYDPREYVSLERGMEVAQIGFEHRMFKAPGHRVFLARALIGLDSYLKQLGTVANWHRIFRDCVERYGR